MLKLSHNILLSVSLLFFLFKSLQYINEQELYTTLYNGDKIPLVGLGTWKSKPGVVEDAVKTAINAGYRLIDGAAAYENEKEIGNALKEVIGTVCSREELFITSKLWNTKHRPEDVRPAFMQTLTDLQLDYLDLYLIHWPVSYYPSDVKYPRNSDGTVIYDNVPPVNTWVELEKLVDEGLVRHIGLSNFNSQQVDEIMSKCRIQPAVIQCESHPYLNQLRLIDHVTKYKIIFEAYSPLGSPDRPWGKEGEPVLLNDPQVAVIAKKYNKSVAQILIRFQVERGVVVIPKSVTPERIKANYDVFDFKLTSEDMSVLRSLERNWRSCLPKIEVNGELVPRDATHPYYPFNIEY